MPDDQISEINIRPRVTILSVLQHLNYKPWFALAEFVDNALQSHVMRKVEIQRADGRTTGLRVDIEIENAPDRRIVIRDNAGGIAMADFPRAFRPAELPPDRSALAEFGMGMKSAACWFSPEWTVRTKALGEAFERTVYFDITRIVADGTENIPIKAVKAAVARHYTEIALLQPRMDIVGRTLGKVRDHLADIYRMFIRRGDIQLVVGGKELEFVKPSILTAPKYTNSNQPVGDPLEWSKEVEVRLGNGATVRGFAAILEAGDTALAGFSLFRRDRLIVGSFDEKWRPARIFGSPNDYAYQRVFGELSVDGIPVSHTKDGFRWEDSDEELAQKLAIALDSEPLPLLRQARNFRARRAKASIETKATAATEATAKDFLENVTAILPDLVKSRGPAQPPSSLPRAPQVAKRAFDLAFAGRRWSVTLEIVDDPAIGDWVSFSRSPTAGAGRGDGDALGLRLNLAHPFSERFLGATQEFLEPMVRLAAALGIAERAASEANAGPGGVRINLNRVLREGFARA